MGVRGLATYLNHEKNTRIQQCYQVISQFPVGCELFIDGNALVYFILQEFGIEMCAIKSGGSYHRFRCALLQWFQDLRKLTGARLYVFSDGHKEQPEKRETHLKRDLDKLNRIYGMSQSLQHDGKLVCVKEDLGSRINSGLYLACVASVCTELQIDFLCCEGEADKALADAVILNRSFACLSNDSDFHCLGAPYIPLDSIKMTEQTISAHLFEPEQTIRCLGLPSVKHLRFLGCLIGNDYIFGVDLNCIYQALELAIPTTNEVYKISLVCEFLSKYKTADELQVRCEELQNNAPSNVFPIWVKFLDALKKYDTPTSSSDAQKTSSHSTERQVWSSLDKKFIKFTAYSHSHTPRDESKHNDSKLDHYECTNAHGILCDGLSSKLYAFAKRNNSREVFSYSVHPKVIQPQPRSVLIDSDQRQASDAFQALRMRVISCFFGREQPIKEERQTTSGISVLSSLTSKLNLPQVDMERFLLLIDEKAWAAADVALQISEKGTVVTFGLLVLRCLSRLIQLSDKEKHAIFLHFYPQTGNAPISRDGGVKRWTEDGDWTPSARSVHIVSMFETCFLLCLAASLSCFGLFYYSVLAVPSDAFDAERLIGELEGEYPLSDENMALFADDDKNCKFGSACRLISCQSKHMPGVWGQCSYDGECTNPRCKDRHMKQATLVARAICKYDGKCLYLGTSCKFVHTKQTVAYANSEQQPQQLCRFGKTCRRLPDGCVFFHPPETQPL